MSLDRKIKKASLVLIILLIVLVAGTIFSRLHSVLSAIISIITPFFLALVVAYIFDPVTDRLEEMKISRNLAILIQIAALFLISLGLGMIILPTLINEIIQFINKVPDITAWLINFTKDKVPIPEIREYIEKYLSSITAENLNTYIPKATNIFNQLTGNLYSGLMGVLGFTGNLFIFLVASFYFLRDFDKLKNQLIGLIPISKRKIYYPVLKKVDELLKGFFRGQFIVINILALLNVIGLTLVGLEFSIIIGILAGYLNIIPYFGSAVGVLLSLILAFIQFGDILHLIYVALVFGVVQALDAYLITPKILGNKTGLSPVVIIFSLIFFGYLFGFFGMLLAIPISVIIKVFLEFYIERYKSSSYYSQKN